MKKLLILFSLLATLPLAAQPNQAKQSTCATNLMVMAPRASRLYTVTVYNSSASTLYLHVIDTNSTPATGTYPTLPPLQIPSGSTGGYDFPLGRNFSVGVTVATSTTPITFTNGSASFNIEVTYGGSQ